VKEPLQPAAVIDIAPPLNTLTPRERFAAALDRRPLPGLVPHFELVFFLTMEAFGRVHPLHRDYRQWHQMTRAEQALHRRDIARIYVETARHFGHDAIFIHPPVFEPFDEVLRLLDEVRSCGGDRYFLLMHGDPTFEIPDGEHMMSLTERMAEDPESVEAEAARRVEKYLRSAELLRRHGVDGLALAADYCFNTGPFLSPEWFDRFILPYLKQAIAEYRALGLYTIKHTDGNIMPILDRLVEANPHALHSLDPQGGVDMAEIVARCGQRVALCGNVNCGLMQTGTDEEVIASARYALAAGMKAPGYIFSTSNCIYTGMPLERYELILKVWREHGLRPPGAYS
jgi:uroporphyrinogen decarboxylase